jgi:hypothetical protein
MLPFIGQKESKGEKRENKEKIKIKENKEKRKGTKEEKLTP